MPAIDTQAPTTAELDRKVMRQWYQGKLAERLMQATAMVEDRSLLRRGARKMQDGVLGTTNGENVEEEPVNITIGDQIFNQAAPNSTVAAVVATPTATQVVAAPSAETPLWQKLLASAALLAGGAGAGTGIPWLLGAFDQPATVQQVVPGVDTDTQYQLSIMPEADK